MFFLNSAIGCWAVSKLDILPLDGEKQSWKIEASYLLKWKFLCKNKIIMICFTSEMIRKKQFQNYKMPVRVELYSLIHVYE